MELIHLWVAAESDEFRMASRISQDKRQGLKPLMPTVIVGTTEALP
jgi:hypothetical protein